MGAAKRGSHPCFASCIRLRYTVVFSLSRSFAGGAYVGCAASSKERTSKIHNHTITSGRGLASRGSGNGFQTKAAGFPSHITFFYLFSHLQFSETVRQKVMKIKRSKAHMQPSAQSKGGEIYWSFSWNKSILITCM